MLIDEASQRQRVGGEKDPPLFLTTGFLVSETGEHERSTHHHRRGVLVLCFLDMSILLAMLSCSVDEMVAPQAGPMA